MSEGRFADWTPQDLANKADWEGGVYGLIQWGGPNVFTCLGPEAVDLARQASDALGRLSAMLPEPGEDDHA